MEQQIDIGVEKEQLPGWLDETKPAPATRIIIVINVAVFLAMTLSTIIVNVQNTDGLVDPRQGLLFFSSRTLTQWGANAAWKTIIDREYWRIFTSAFIHLNIFHLIMNAYVLSSFSSMAERLFGTSKFVGTYILSAVGSAICSLFFLSPEGISVGASGAIFGTFGALVAFFWSHRAQFPKLFFQTHTRMFFVFVIYGVVSAFIFEDMDNAAHLSGFIVGLWAGLCVNPVKPDSRKWRHIDFVRTVGLVSVLVVGLVLISVFDERNPKIVGEHEYAEAVTLLKNDKAEQAVVFLDRALTMMPNNVSAYLDRATAFNQVKQYDKAIVDSTKAINLDPKNKKGYFVRSLAYHNVHDESKSMADLNRVLEIDPRAALALNNRAWSYVSQNNIANAINDSTAAIAVDKHCASAYDTRGVAYCLKGEYENALRDFSQCIDLIPKDGAVYYHRAYVFDKLGKKDAAVSDLKKGRASKYELEPWELRFFHYSEGISAG